MEEILPASVPTPEDLMDVLEAIHKRQSRDKVRQDVPPKEAIRRLLDAGNQAPNHYKVRPWRFVVLIGKGREKLGEVMAASQRDRKPDLPEEAFTKTRALPLRAPVVIAVGVDKPTEEKVLEIENVCAAAAACQNILLAAEAEGLAAKWRTGEWARDAMVKEFLGFSPDQHLIAFLYIGYPGFTPEPPHRPPVDDRVMWIEA